MLASLLGHRLGDKGLQLQAANARMLWRRPSASKGGTRGMYARIRQSMPARIVRVGVGRAGVLWYFCRCTWRGKMGAGP